MRSFIIRISTGEYLTKVRIISNYLKYEFTTDRVEASRLNDFDSQPQPYKGARLVNPQRPNVIGSTITRLSGFLLIPSSIHIR